MPNLEMPVEERVLYKAYPHQLPIHKSTAKTKVLVQPIRSGKDIVSIEDDIIDMIGKYDQWSIRPREMSPKWHIALLAPTYKLGKQKFHDLCNLMPREWMAGDPIEGKMEMPLRNGAVAQVYSMDNPDWLVSMAWDRIDGTEMWLAKRQAWNNAQTRQSSPGRTQLASAILNSTPGDKIDPDDFERDNYMWELALDGMNPERWTDIQTFYWYEMRRDFGNIDHPILSLTTEGREELERKKRDPNFSDQEYDRQYRGRVMTLAEGVAVVNGFLPEIHVREFEPMYQAPLFRTWDFGLNFPICIFHQFDSVRNTWYVPAMCAPINQNKLDEDFADDVLLMTKEIFPKFDESRIHDPGDFEAVQQTDQRKESTIQALKNKGIRLIVEPTNSGDEQQAIQVLNARMKLRQDGSPNIVIHPRCKLLIRGLEGKISHPVRKIANTTRIMPNVAEIHPWIDIFDSLKYAVKHIPNLKQGFRINSEPIVSPTQDRTFNRFKARPR
jgi:hypothetical protein